MKPSHIAIVLAFGLIGCRKPHHFYAEKSGGARTNISPDTPAQSSGGTSSEDIYALRIKDMQVDQLRDARIVYEQQEEPTLLAKVLERLIKLSPDHQERAACTAQLATMNLGMGQFEKARTLYQQFLQEYPGSPLRQQVMFRLIMAYHWDRAVPQKDQELTLQTMQWCDRFIAEYGTLPLPASPEQRTEHESVIAAIKSVKRSCLYDLMLGELERLNFYATKYTVTQEYNALKAAHDRLKYLLETWSSVLESLDISLEPLRDLAQEQDFLKRQDTPLSESSESESPYDDPLGTMSDIRHHFARNMIAAGHDLEKHILDARDKDSDALISQLW